MGYQAVQAVQWYNSAGRLYVSTVLAGDQVPVLSGFSVQIPQVTTTAGMDSIDYGSSDSGTAFEIDNQYGGESGQIPLRFSDGGELFVYNSIRVSVYTVNKTTGEITFNRTMEAIRTFTVNTLVAGVPQYSVCSIEAISASGKYVMLKWSHTSDETLTVYQCVDTTGGSIVWANQGIIAGASMFVGGVACDAVYQDPSNPDGFIAALSYTGSSSGSRLVKISASGSVSSYGKRLDYTYETRFAAEAHSIGSYIGFVLTLVLGINSFRYKYYLVDSSDLSVVSVSDLESEEVSL